MLINVMEDFIRAEIARFLASKERALMLTGERYYKNDHDIIDRKRQYVDEEGKAHPEPNLANNRVPHAFLRALVDQKTGYLLGKPFSFQAESDAYGKALAELMDEDFRRMLKDVGEEAVIKGLAWVQPHYDEEGALRFVRIPSEQVHPLWADNAHTKLDAVIRVYDVDAYDGAELKTITKVEYWDASGVKHYELSAQGLIPDVSQGDGGEAYHMADTKGRPMNWERLPFVCFKYNKYEIPLIKYVKGLIDDYDARTSDDANNLEDLPNSVLVIQNYDGANLGEFRRNLALYRAVKVSGDGGVSALTVPVEMEAVARHLERTRRDIYAFGRGVDPLSDNTGNASGVALKFLYAHLDVDCNIMESEFSASLKALLWFYTTHLANTGGGDFAREKVEFAFNRDIIISETDAIQGVKDSVGILSEETVLSMHPAVSDVQEELRRKKKEAEEQSEDVAYPPLFTPPEA